MTAPSDNPRAATRAPDGDRPFDREHAEAPDGDTPPHGVPPVVVPRTLARTDAGPRPGRRAPRVEGRGRHRRGRRARLTRRARRILLVLAVLVVVVGGGGGWIESEASPSGTPGAPVVVHVHRGESLGAVMATLTRDGVVGSALAFRLWSILHGGPTVLPGLYQLRRNLSFGAVSADLSAGPNVYSLDVVPGTTVTEIANQLSQLPGNLAQTFETAARTGAVPSPYQPQKHGSLEGLIAAGRYQITPGESGKTLLSRMVARFDAEAAAAGLSPTTTVGGQSAYGVITVASIAMKEGYYPRYFGRVARVVYNRLADGMHLDMTSTVLYSLGQDGGPVTPAEEQVTSPYNTYLRPGLTPTPICTPSRAALAAAAAPPPGPWLYFELTTPKKGVMVFSASYTTQLAAEQAAANNPASSSPGSSQGSATSSGSGSGTGT